jgi:hypothetical protein
MQSLRSCSGRAGAPGSTGRRSSATAPVKVSPVRADLPVPGDRPLRLARSGWWWPQPGRRLFGDCSPLPLTAWPRWHAVGITSDASAIPRVAPRNLPATFGVNDPTYQHCRARQIPDGGIGVSQITLDRCDSARDQSPRKRPGSGRACRTEHSTQQAPVTMTHDLSAATCSTSKGRTVEKSGFSNGKPGFTPSKVSMTIWKACDGSITVAPRFSRPLTGGFPGRVQYAGLPQPWPTRRDLDR